MPAVAVLRTAGAVLAVGCLSVACSGSGTPARTRPSATSMPTASTQQPARALSTSPVTSTHPAASSAPRHSPAATRRLPLDLPTDDANELITVAAPDTTSITATLQAWQRAGSSWQPVGPAVPAHLGAAGLTIHPSESTTATPIGSFTLTEAFGEQPNPGTALPYTRTTPDDWWISQPGPLYNTRQRCAAHCPFTQGAPNEHLYYELPYYRYAVVIDYNTRNAPGGVRQGAGSAFFLHVTVGQPTQGCVSIPEDQLLRLLHWLRPADRPRILIGVS